MTLNADFSANNIGKIDIPAEPTARQKAIMAKYSRALTSAQQSAFVAFMNALEDNNILSKMNALYLPIMAGATSEAFVNVVDPNLDADFSLNSAWKLDTDGGVYFDPTGTFQALGFTTAKQLNGLTLGDWHLLWSCNLRNKEVTASAGVYNHPYFPRLIDGSATTYFNINTGGAGNGSWMADSQRFNISGNQTEMLSLFNISSYWSTPINIDKTKDDLNGISSVADKYYLLSQSQKRSYDKLSGADLTPSLPSFDINGSESIDPGIQAPCRVLSVGHGLTEAEYDIYVNAMQAFLNEF